MVKQWDSTLDGRTRESHTWVDGEIRELDKPFSNGLDFPGDPAGGAAEVINCRCALLQRARWALDEDELEELKRRAEYFGLDKTANFEDYKKKYLKAADDFYQSDDGSDVSKLSKKALTKSSNRVKISTQFFAESDIKKQESGSLKRAIRKYQKRIIDHQKKISDPQKYVSDWDTKSEQAQNGLKKHWQKEIKNFQTSIADTIAELKERGDYDD